MGPNLFEMVPTRALRGRPRYFPRTFSTWPIFLDFPAYLFVLAFAFQVGIVRRSSNLLFNYLSLREILLLLCP
jgi:hypothetical protein